jgi:hypothetical protein
MMNTVMKLRLLSPRSNIFCTTRRYIYVPGHPSVYKVADSFPRLLSQEENVFPLPFVLHLVSEKQREAEIRTVDRY